MPSDEDYHRRTAITRLSISSADATTTSRDYHRVKSCVARRKDGKNASKPTYTNPTITYDARTMTIFEDTDEVSLTMDGDYDRIRGEPR